MGLGLGLGLGLANRLFAASGYGDDFVFTVETTAPDEVFTTPCQNIGVFNAIMDYGDGSSSHITAYNDADLAHTYANAGIHTIRISGTFPNIYFNNGGDKEKVRSVIQLGKVGWAALNKAFYGCSGMTSFVAGTCNTSLIDDLTQTLRDCTSLIHISLVGMDLSKVVTFLNMCRGDSNLVSFDITGVDTTLAENFQDMFYSCVSLNADLSALNFAVTTNLTHFLYNCDSMSAENLDNLFRSIYEQRASITWETPAIDTGNLTNDPTGVYQDATPPTTGLEYIYKLVNDPDAEGFNVWTITY